ncbi:MAG: SagB/ThcOx family dehydrogenase [Polyangiaceae bacterium]|jgi:SagB-type dehydrogenase family enzyme
MSTGPHRLPLASMGVAAPLADALDAQALAEETAIAYHERTKHHFERYAASLGYLDWTTQPDPFRRYSGADVVRLPLPEPGRPLPYDRLYGGLAEVKAEPLSLESVSLLFRYALSLTAWKRLGQATWSLRANPSSGNLHPTEGYAILPPIQRLGDAPGVYHYAPREHALERRAVLAANQWALLCPPPQDGSFLVGLTSIHWREAWKYGERSFRYCQHDVGHALASLRIAAAALGWRLAFLDGFGSRAIAGLLGLDRGDDYGTAEHEESELLAWVAPASSSTALRRLEGFPVCLDAHWSGKANVLSVEHGVEWPVIDQVARATRQPARPPIEEDFLGFPSHEEIFGQSAQAGRLTAERAILGRRSAVAMDGSTVLAREVFFRMLARLMPTRDGRSMPWDALPWRPRIHLGLFVHRVRDLPAGLYALVRDPDKVPTLKHVIRPESRWERPPSCPSGLPLYLLEPGDCRDLATTVSCGQSIAGDGAFSLGMIADYTESLTQYGAAFYRNLFREAGMVGQVLYLESEEAGIRATGIGCYFDDAVHEAFGITSRDWQIFYHFTVGGPVEDTRLTTLPAYTLEHRS